MEFTMPGLRRPNDYSSGGSCLSTGALRSDFGGNTRITSPATITTAIMILTDRGIGHPQNDEIEISETWPRRRLGFKLLGLHFSHRMGSAAMPRTLRKPTDLAPRRQSGERRRLCPGGSCAASRATMLDALAMQPVSYWFANKTPLQSKYGVDRSPRWGQDNGHQVSGLGLIVIDL
jgi:hypothetical protein